MRKSNKSATAIDGDQSRRDFIHIATGGVAAFGVAALVWPMIAQMAPAADSRQFRSIPVDLKQIPEGHQIRVFAFGRPIFIRHRTAAEIIAAQNVDIAELIHPETDDQRLVPMPNGKLNRKFLVLIGICPHFGAIPVGEQGVEDPSGSYGGWYCRSHGAQFDTSGRIRSAPATRNMEIPPYRYVSETVIEIMFRARL